MKKHLAVVALLLGLVAAGSGCMAARARMVPATVPAGRGIDRAEGAAVLELHRMLIKSASLDVEVNDVKSSYRRATHITEAAGGYIHNSNMSSDSGAWLSIRVPAPKLDAVLDQIGDVGKEKSRNISSSDVTGQVIDMEATLKNKMALRDRLRKLLDKTDDVGAILSLEREITRLQAEIDALDGRVKAMKGMAQMSSIDVSLHKKRILGPIGLLGKGVFWAIGKMFIIQ